ncbi:bifunctional hydroxymethylpyrimidine kinase/phosphomethylpyrimidine kinase [Sporosarcina gallistercoris]|uniref:bifunctional hydroxymethylpyrimidine kinase/phosphomethylpyrimidine kinase n=1 Tax=Sporosarcina gallistercoris TaxID=2762245 RepID=UPI003D29B3A3
MTSVALTIAGSDSGGGAGIQADLKTFQELGVFGTSVLTAITAQNTLGVHAVQSVDVKMVTAQLQAVLDDLPVKAIKTGMLFSSEIIEAVANELTAYSAVPLVIDPVMIAKGGAALLQNEAVIALRSHLLPAATLITPNIPEAEVLTGQPILSERDMTHAATVLLSMGASAVLLKGGHRQDVPYAEDLFMTASGEHFLMRSKRIATQHTHGTGCTFAAAVTAELAKGHSLEESVVTAKNFIQLAIEDGIELGHGNGPTNHAAFRKSDQLKTGEVELIERC